MQPQFLQLEQIIQKHESLWRFEPFHQSMQSEFTWCLAYPELCRWISALSIEQVRDYKLCTSRLISDLAPIFPDATLLKALVALPRVNTPLVTLKKGIDSGIPGKKLDQIVSMGSFALANQQGSQWLEWCSGKGYLGRILASNSKQPVTSFEWQPALCDLGQDEADKQSLSMTFIQGDALSNEAKSCINEHQHAVALHACGDLHVRLIQHASAIGSQAITISPCCYHLIEKDLYQPLSQLGSRSSLTLTKSELRIPLQETVTGGKRVTRHREEEMCYRLGFDLILRKKLGLSDYVAIPSIKKSMLSLGFEHFCLWAADQKRITLPIIDFSYWEAEGTNRFWQMEKLSLTQQLFRRPLELWLVLDRAIYLQEQGYHVSIAEFCERSTTPRNIIIHAERKKGWQK